MSSIDLYAVLGVAPEASTDEIRAAWKRAVADLDPTDPKLNVFNQAGAVLLDADRRAAYDREVAAAGAEEPATAASAEPAPEPEPEPQPEPASQPTDDSTDGTDRTGASSPVAPSAPREIPTSLLAAVGALLVAAVLAAVFAAGPLGRLLPDRGVPASEQRLGDAVAAAEKVAVPVMSYDYRHMEQDEKAALSHLTPDFAKQYRDLFGYLKQNASETQSVVTVKVVGSAVAASDDTTVDVLLMVDRPTTKKGQSAPVVYKDFVTLTMRESGDRWLVDDLKGAPTA